MGDCTLFLYPEWGRGKGGTIHLRDMGGSNKGYSDSGGTFIIGGRGVRYRFCYMLCDVGVSDVSYKLIMVRNEYMTWGL